ncbi:MAG: hypothetical protein ACOC10_10460, partial [Bacteroidota bacterium]
MKRRLYSFMALLLVAVFFYACSSQEKSTGINPDDLDTTVDPAHDFDQYANGGWKAHNPLPGD